MGAPKGDGPRLVQVPDSPGGPLTARTRAPKPPGTAGHAEPFPRHQGVRRIRRRAAANTARSRARRSTEYRANDECSRRVGTGPPLGPPKRRPERSAHLPQPPASPIEAPG